MWIYNVVTESWKGPKEGKGPKMNMKRFNHACFLDEVTSSIYVVGRVDDQWKSLSSTEK